MGCCSMNSLCGWMGRSHHAALTPMIVKTLWWKQRAGGVQSFQVDGFAYKTQSCLIPQHVIISLFCHSSEYAIKMETCPTLLHIYFTGEG